MLQIPVQPVPSQLVLCVLDGQNCQIAIYARTGNGNTSVYADVNVNGVDVCVSSIAQNGVPIDPRNSYDGFSGNLFFIDTQGLDDPQYTGLGSRWVLVYLTAAELMLTAPVFGPPAPSSPVLTLAATLQVTASVAGNFSAAHGLFVTPFLIEIIPTAPGLIWGQVAFADATNINLVASDAGISATVNVFTITASGLQTQAPAATLLVTSPAPGPFVIAHGIGAVPSFIEVLPTAGGLLWTDSPAFDGTNIYLEASDAGVTATIRVYGPSSGAVNVNGPIIKLGAISVAPGPLVIAHGLTPAPSRIQILMISAGLIWADTPAFDGTNVYLEASDAGVAANVYVY